MVARTRLIVTCYVHCQFCYSEWRPGPITAQQRLLLKHISLIDRLLFQNSALILMVQWPKCKRSIELVCKPEPLEYQPVAMSSASFLVFQICGNVLVIFTVCQLCRLHHRLLHVQTPMPVVCTFQLHIWTHGRSAPRRPSSAQCCPEDRLWGLHKYAFPCIRIVHIHMSVVIRLWAAD
jgi:hypothetical protein